MDTWALVLVGVAVLLVVVIWLLARRKTIHRGIAQERGSPRRYTTSLARSLRRIWGSGLDDSTWAEMTDALVGADIGLASSEHIVDAVKKASPATAEEASECLAAELRRILGGRERSLTLTGRPAVVLIVGVNGSGKTTTIAKLTRRILDGGQTVLLAAADTFRAAARAQLESWGSRIGVDVIGGQEGGDPASVVFDALAAARARNCDVVIVDTAGRLHSKKNLMSELSKIHRVAAGERGKVDEVLLVLDATGGQNGLAQVRDFTEAVPLTGIVLTKLDGTAKGGIIVAVEQRLGVPVKLVGLGEGPYDLEAFDPDRFVNELLEQK